MPIPGLTDQIAKELPQPVVVAEFMTVDDIAQSA
jgi:hypothetical protein